MKVVYTRDMRIVRVVGCAVFLLLAGGLAAEEKVTVTIPLDRANAGLASWQRDIPD